MSEELKPCPFCGGEARMTLGSASSFDGSMYVYVFVTAQCTECDAMVTDLLEYVNPEDLTVPRWNARAGHESCKGCHWNYWDEPIGSGCPCHECSRRYSDHYMARER